jgi:FkbM family methyltransferase
LYFLKIYFTLAFKEGLDENDFEGRWKKFEKIRKEVGKKLKFNIFTNTFSLYEFKSKAYPDTGLFPDFLDLHKIFKKKKYRAIFDLGAFIGDTPYCFAKTFKVDKVYAFEPDPDNFKILKENLRLNKLEDVVIPVELGVGKEKGSFYLKKAGGASAVGVKQSKDTVKVRVTTIDDFVEENKIKRVDFIKMDIEGAEFDALKGAVKTIKRDTPDLSVTIYHKGEHFFEIPGWLKKLVPQYNLRFIAMNGASPVIERYIGASIMRI